jgi:hypothetical protein
MDYSEYLRRKQETSNSYISRNKSVDSSFLTMQKQQKAAYSGSAIKNTPTYFNGDLVVNPILYDVGSCPKNHLYTQGYTDSNPLAQQERQTDRKAGGVLCSMPDYATSPPGMMLKSATEISTIQASYIATGPAPGQWKPLGQGTYFPPVADKNSQSTCCVANKYPYSSG